MLDCDATVAFPGMFPSRSRGCKQKSGYLCRHKNERRPMAAVLKSNHLCVQVRLVSTKFWPLELVQLSWLVEIIRQLKLTGVWRISEVPLIWTDVAPVMV